MSPQELNALLKHWARQSPERVFLCASTQMTFAEAEAQTEARARWLVSEWRGGPLVLAGANDQRWMLNLLAARRGRIPVVLLPPGWTAGEEAQAFAAAGATLRVEGDSLTPVEAPFDRAADWEMSGAALGFPTSGSTGNPRIALRSESSIIAEGERYRALWRMTSADVVAAALPLSHAYTFGAALAAALAVGATLALDDFLSPRRLARFLVEKQVSIVPLVGPVARTLARLDAGQPVASSLRIAMVGAGVVTEEMSQLFESKWGLPLSQNYGSSETGAMLASFPPHATKGTGFPLPGVECALSAAADGTSQLWVRTTAPPLGYMSEAGFEAARLAPGGWWATGDLFREDEEGGLYTMMGRLGQQIRRGGHTVHPRELERVLLSHPSVEDAVVRGGQDADGQEAVEAYVMLKPGAQASVAQLREHMLSHLAPHKCPTRWSIEKEFPRTWSHKPMIRPRDPQPEKTATRGGSTLFDALLSHRLSAALVAAEATGLLGELAAGARTPEQLVAALRLKADALGLFLKFLSAAGIVREEGGGFRLAETNYEWLRPAIAFEARLRESWLSPEAVVDVLRLGLQDRGFEQQRASDEFARLYRATMCGATQASLARQVVRLSGAGWGEEMCSLEIGRGIGMLSVLLRRQHARAATELIPLAPAPALVCESSGEQSHADAKPVSSWAEIVPAAGRFDVIFVVNGIHWLRVAEAAEVFKRLLAGLSHRGQLLIADMFLPDGDEPRGEGLIPWIFLLDWMTHGGTHLLTVREVEQRLAEAGAAQVGRRRFAGLPFEVIHASAEADVVN